MIKLVVRGRAIGTTAEHPFYVVERNDFVAAGEMEVGETFLSHDGQPVVLEAVRDTGRVETVYNFRIADFHTYFVGGKEWGFSVWVHNQYRKLVSSASEVPTFKSGDFDDWFDSLSARTVKRLYADPVIRAKIETQLRGSGGLHEYLMVATAPQWKKWGITMKQFREMTVPIDELNRRGGLAKGWRHSTGDGRLAKYSKTAHNELQFIIEKSTDFMTFKRAINIWSKEWLRNGAQSLPKGLR